MQETKQEKTRLLPKAIVVLSGATLTLGLGIAPSQASPTENESSTDEETTNSDNVETEDIEDSDELSDEEIKDLDDEEIEDLFDRGVFDIEDERLFQLSINIPDSEIEEEEEYSSYVVISSSDDDRSITIRDNEKTVAEALESRDISLSGYRDEDGERVSSEDLEELTLDNDETLLLHTHERSIDTEEVVLEYRTEEVETDELYVGEEEIEQEGVNGTALNMSITSGHGDEQTTSNRLTVVSAPQREIILIGTAERPEPEPEPETQAEPDTEADTQANLSEIDTNDYTGLGDPEAGYNDGTTTEIDTSSSTGHEIVDTAMQHVGGRYSWGGTSPSTGFDCSGLIYWAAQQNGMSIPRVAIDQGTAGTPVSWDDIQVGDLIYTSSHIGMYAGNGQILHAANPNTGVALADVSFYRDRGFQVSRLF